MRVSKKHSILYHSILFLITSLIFVSSCQKKQEETKEYTKIESLDFSSPNTLIAGEILTLHLNLSSEKIPENLLLVSTSMVGSDILEIKKKKITLDSIITQKSGILFLELYQEDQLLFEKEITIRPGKAVDKMQSYIGPKSIITTTSEPAMLIAMPTDEFKNPPEENTPNYYKLIRPNKSIEHHEIKINHLISHHTFYSQEKTGKTLCAIQCDQSISKEKYVDEEPGWPHEIKIDNPSFSNLSDGNHFTTIKTNPIKDKIGNLVMDGTIVTFSIINNKNKISQYTGVTVEGVAKIQFKNPIVSEIYKIQALSGNAKSNTIRMIFKSIINNFEIAYIPEQQKIIVGPITTYLGQYVPDGHEVLFRIKEENKKEKNMKAILKDGMAFIPLKELFISSQEFEVLARYSDKTIVKKITL